MRVTVPVAVVAPEVPVTVTVQVPAVAPELPLPPPRSIEASSKQAVDTHAMRYAGQVFDRVISHFKVRGFPSFRQKKGEMMGHRAGTKTSGERPGPVDSSVALHLLYSMSSSPPGTVPFTNRPGVDHVYHARES